MEIEFYEKHNLNKKLLIADRDGTLNFDCGYPHKIKDLSLLKFVIDQIEPYSNLFEIAIVTNQSGIGRGLFTENQVKVFNHKLVNNLNKKGIVVTTICICPHKPEDNCRCRKPKTKLIEKTLEINFKDKSQTFMIGDKRSDYLAAKLSGVKYEGVSKQMNKLKNWLNEK